jgi:hypothetical protein
MHLRCFGVRAQSCRPVATVRTADIFHKVGVDDECVLVDDRLLAERACVMTCPCVPIETVTLVTPMSKKAL